MEPHSLNDWQFDQNDQLNSPNEVKSSTLPRVYPVVPKSRPPAKPPRRKLSYPSEGTGTTNTSRSSDSPVLLRKNKSSEKLSTLVKQEGISKTNGCSHSAKSEVAASFLEGSDYGSLPSGDHWPRTCFIDHQKCQGLGHFTSFDSKFPAAHPRLSSTPNGNAAEHLFCHPSLHALRQSPSASIYFTPPCTPHRHQHGTMQFAAKDICKCGEGLHLSDSMPLKTQGGRGSPIAVPKVAKHRRHHSDPQISLERRPSANIYCNKNKSRRGDNFVGPSLQECHGFLEAAMMEPAVLMEELRMLREICNKLWRQLQEAQMKIERLQNGQAMSVQIEKPHFSELLSQIYYAQKERDQAVWARIDLAYKERQQAIRQLEHLKQVLTRHNLKEVYSSDDEGEELNNDKGIEKVLENIEQTNSPAKLLQHRDTLLTSITRIRDQRHHRVLQELKAVLADRDDAVSKALMLQEELEHLLKAKSSWEKNSSNWKMMTTLQKAKEERDQAITRMERVKQEVESLHLHHGLSSYMGEKDKSLETSNSMACRAQSFREKRTENKNQVNSFSSLPLLHLLANEEAGAEENLHLQQKLEQEMRCRQEMEEKYKKLERIVDVLRKKMSGLSVGMPV